MDTTTTAAAPAMGTMKYAGFWIRLLAMIIDTIVLSIISYPFGATTFTNGGFSLSYTGWTTLIPVVYTLGFWIWQSTTPGKMVLGLKIVKENGANLDVAAAIIRYVGYFISGFVFCIGFIWIGFDAKKQGWHDKLAKTFVVKK